MRRPAARDVSPARGPARGSMRDKTLLFICVHNNLFGLALSPFGRTRGAIKRPVAAHVRADLLRTKSRLLKRLTVQARGHTVFRYWQKGPGFDRNLFTVAAVQASIDYSHNNPVKRGLCQKARDWRWSSARFYESDGSLVDPLLPLITPLPAEFCPWRIKCIGCRG